MTTIQRSSNPGAVPKMPDSSADDGGSQDSSPDSSSPADQTRGSASSSAAVSSGGAKTSALGGGSFGAGEASLSGQTAATSSTEGGSGTSPNSTERAGVQAVPGRAGSEGKLDLPSKGVASAAVQAGSGDVMVRSARPKVESKALVDDVPDDVPDDGPDDGVDADGPDGAGFIQRMFARATQRSGARLATSDVGADGGDGADASTASSRGQEGAASGLSKTAGKRGRGKRASKGAGKKGGAARGGARVRAAEGRDRTEDVEQVSVLVGQDESGGDPVEQALAAKRKIIGDEERKNAFTSHVVDDFDPRLDSQSVERLGAIQGAVHMVRLSEHWEKDGLDRAQIISEAAKKLLGFTRPDQVKKMLGEMNTAPIKQVYPLEVALEILGTQPEALPRTKRSEVLINRSSLVGNPRIQAGHEFRVKYSPDLKIKAFALLGGGEPGYEFAPYKNGVYRLVVDTPGSWTFALSADRKGETFIDTFTVEVHEPGRVAGESDAEAHESVSSD